MYVLRFLGVRSAACQFDFAFNCVAVLQGCKGKIFGPKAEVKVVSCFLVPC